MTTKSASKNSEQPLAANELTFANVQMYKYIYFMDLPIQGWKAHRRCWLTQGVVRCLHVCDQINFLGMQKGLFLAVLTMSILSTI